MPTFCCSGAKPLTKQVNEPISIEQLRKVEEYVIVSANKSKKLPWVQETTRLLNPAGQRQASVRLSIQTRSDAANEFLSGARRSRVFQK